MHPRTCVAPPGRFIYGIHSPDYSVFNLREKESIGPLGVLDDGHFMENGRNFPRSSFPVENADQVFEIPNPLPFRGTTYILKTWADRVAKDPGRIKLPPPAETSLTKTFSELLPNPDEEQLDKLFAGLPTSVQLAIATTSTDPADLIRLVKLSCDLVHGTRTGKPAGMKFSENGNGVPRPRIHNHPVFEALANNPHLPDDYKLVMVLRAGVQGTSEIVGETRSGKDRSHVFEYLRRNSYIPWGHYASNMAEDAIRYRTTDLSCADMQGLRHLYYQRTYVRLAEHLGLTMPQERQTMSAEQLEELRENIVAAIRTGSSSPAFTATLWGWNYGFDFAPTMYRLHASHQQIHTQYALLPATVTAKDSLGKSVEDIPSFGCGDLVTDLVTDYKKLHNRCFFDDYIGAIRSNLRTDGRQTGDSSLVVFEDEQVMLFVPKAQTSQWELQLMPLKPVGNIIEADKVTRASLDQGLLIAQQVLAGLGARMVTSIYFSKRLDAGETGQRLLYSLLPKLPESPGAFSEAQLRWINGHYPEDFATACRAHLPEIMRKINR